MPSATQSLCEAIRQISFRPYFFAQSDDDAPDADGVPYSAAILNEIVSDPSHNHARACRGEHTRHRVKHPGVPKPDRYDAQPHIVAR